MESEQTCKLCTMCFFPAPASMHDDVVWCAMRGEWVKLSEADGCQDWRRLEE